MSNFKKILKKLGDDIISDAKKNLKRRKIDKHSSGKLRKSFSSKVVDDNKVIIYAEDYALYVDEGTKEIKGNHFLSDAVDKNLKTITADLAEAVLNDLKELKIEK